MARTRYFFFEALRRMGNSLFSFFSRCEERGIMPRAARWIKVSVLSAFIAGISALSAASMLNCITCYLPIETQPVVESASVTPNPTAGNDSVTVKANTRIPNPPRDEEYYIEKAICILDDDTTEMSIQESDLEGRKKIEARLYVGDLGTGLWYVYVKASNNHDEWGEDKVDLEVTEAQ
ncbi:hypothetical protein CEE36_10190 [candidate division TA06 bacterium B3_TA06]|uniref:Uncharacterized protein n=1 Tax=candidate division TA06 bacterium B3_TA06 TaxID=2012487 RepID=A0A532UY65_UNCT6|nr:MAG: hypothetical protein CEE36_10190 [candidate division TA06 bacterium B3_TA06]